MLSLDLSPVTPKIKFSSKSVECAGEQLQRLQKCNQLLFLLIAKFRFQHQVEEFNRIIKGEQSAVMHMPRRQ